MCSKKEAHSLSPAKQMAATKKLKLDIGRVEGTDADETTATTEEKETTGTLMILYFILYYI